MTQEKLKLGEEAAKRELTDAERQTVDNLFLLTERALSIIEGIEPKPWQRANRIEVLKHWAYDPPIPADHTPRTKLVQQLAALTLEHIEEAIRLLSRPEVLDQIRVFAHTEMHEDDVSDEVYEKRLTAIKELAGGDNRSYARRVADLVTERNYGKFHSETFHEGYEEAVENMEAILNGR